MLRITRTSRDDGRVVLKLEGRLVGPWVELLDDMCQAYRREPEKDAPIILDGAAVGFASEEGLDLLRDLHKQGSRSRPVRPFYKSSFGKRRMCGSCRRNTPGETAGDPAASVLSSYAEKLALHPLAAWTAAHLKDGDNEC